MDDSTRFLVTTVVAIVIAAAGYWAKYENDLAIARRKDRLDRVNRQLGELYGPLYAHLTASDAAWDAFFRAYSPNPATAGKPASFFHPKEPTDEQLATWRLWMMTVFMPLNNAMVDAIAAHADLIEDNAMPPCFVALSAHVAAYRALLKRWEAGDYSRHTSLLKYPRAELFAYLEPAYQRLKGRQAQLLAADDAPGRGRRVRSRPAASGPPRPSRGTMGALGGDISSIVSAEDARP